MVDEDSTLFYYCWSSCSQPANYSQGSDSELFELQEQEQEQEQADDNSDFRLSKVLDKDKGVLRRQIVREEETPGLEEKEVILKENFRFSIALESLVQGGTESSEHLLWPSGCPGCGRRKLGTKSNNNFQHQCSKYNRAF